jgi:diacylglycerol kinase (ATP)
MPRPLFILNSAAGPEESNQQRLSEIQTWLAKGGLTPEVAYTTVDIPAQELARRAVAEGRELILAGGGDGTVSEIGAELVQKPVTLGILPIGTFNNIARSLGILADLPVACAIVNDGYVREIDIGLANDVHPFFEAAGVGLDATLFPIGEEIKSGRWGRMIEAARLTFQYRRPVVEITFAEPLTQVLPTERRRHASRRTAERNRIYRRALLTVVANGPYYGGGFMVAPGARLTDGRLTVTIYRNFSKLELVRHFWSISRGRYHYSPKVETFYSRELQIGGLEPLPVHVDGKPLGHTPVRLKALPRALRVLVPRRTPAGKDAEPPVALPAEAADDGEGNRTADHGPQAQSGA